MNSKDEIDLREVLLFLLQKKWILGGFIAGFLLISIFYSLSKPNIFLAETVLLPKSNITVASNLGGLASLGGFTGFLSQDTDIQKIKALLNSDELSRNFVEKYDLLPMIYFDKWDSVIGEWNVEDSTQIPTSQTGGAYFKKYILSFNYDDASSLLRIGIKWKEPEVAYELLKQFVDYFYQSLETNDLKKLEVEQSFYREKIQHASNTEVKLELVKALSESVKAEVFVGQNFFTVIDPPVVPIEKVEPKRKIIVAAGAVFGAIFGLLFVFVFEWVKNFQAYSKQKN